MSGQGDHDKLFRVPDRTTRIRGVVAVAHWFILDDSPPTPLSLSGPNLYWLE